MTVQWICVTGLTHSPGKGVATTSGYKAQGWSSWSEIGVDAQFLPRLDMMKRRVFSPLYQTDQRHLKSTTV